MLRHSRRPALLGLLTSAALLASSASSHARGPATTLGDPLPDAAGAHLAISLRLDDAAGLAALLRDQQDPRSPRHHAWLTPEQFGARFGVADATYTRIVDWLASEGFAVTRYPNRLFVEARGTVAGVRRLLGVRPRWATAGGRPFRSHAEAPSLPPDIAPLVVKIGGLDTRLRLRHHLDVTPFRSTPTQALGAADMRVLYDMPATGEGAAGLTLVVLGTQEGTQANKNSQPVAPFIPPSTAAIDAYFTSIASATVAYAPVVLPNAGDDFDYAGSNGEYQLDVEMQSVGAPNAAAIDLVLSPASVVFQTGAQYVVNTLSSAVVVSTSLGECESEEVSEDGGVSTVGSDAYLMRMAVQQGLAEGQTWFAAAGDDGADDCADDTSGTHNGFDGGNATADFPCSLPEIVCLGGTQFQGPGDWSPSGALTAYQAEVVWNEPSGGAGGGGQSLLYAKPSWQAGIGPSASDGVRDVPDFSLTAAISSPGVAVFACGSGQDELSCSTDTVDAGQIDIYGGTSIGAPLAAGFFAHLAGALGCKLGDIHPALYALGLAQQDGGAQPFHDITTGNNDFADPQGATIGGFAASPGFDLATGWGSVDLARLIDAWPPCSADGGLPLDREDAGGVIVEPGDGGRPPPDAGAPVNGAGGASSGCGCGEAGASSSSLGLGASLVALALAAARRRRRSAAGAR